MTSSKIIKSIKLRLYPTEAQKIELNQQFGNVRFVWNHLVHFTHLYYCLTGKSINKKDLAHLVPVLKSYYPFLKFSDKFALEVAMERLLLTYKQLFKGNGCRPTLHKRSFNQSYTTKMTNNNLHFVSDKYFKLPKFKEPFQISGCHIPHHRIKQATIKMTSTGKYFLILNVEMRVQAKPLTGKVVGLDAGLRSNQILSTGLKAKALHFNDLEAKLKSWQRKYARRRKIAITRHIRIQHLRDQNHDSTPLPSWVFDHNVVQASQRVARINQKIHNKRYDFLQKLSTYLVDHYDVIKLEKLDVKNMMKNHKLAHAIGLQGWTMFKNMLIYKCIWYGKELQLVKPAYTTQMCSDCHYVCNRSDGTHVARSIESWTCSKCHQFHDRDVNAAINIKNANPIQTYNTSTGVSGLEL